jgi:PHD/YefM family antitoxin component YafN of YafNO toxin-antitoxin module
MREISSAEAARNFATYRDMAEGASADPEAVAVLHDNKPSVVIVSAAEYARLKQRDKQVMLTEDLPEWLVEHVAATEMEPRFAYC